MPPTTPLVVAIPTVNRPAMLTRAIQSVLGQSEPTRILVAWQGDDGGTADALIPYLGNPLVEVVRTNAKTLRENWLAGLAHACDLPDSRLVAWLQDDDIVAPHYARRIVGAFRAYPDAALYMGRIAISYEGARAGWWTGAGPLVPMDLLTGRYDLMARALVIAAGYVASHALSPAVAFTKDAAEDIQEHGWPDECDLFSERTVIAAAAMLGECIIDPAISGYWIHHPGNESRRQNADDQGPKQYPRLVAYLDELIGEGYAPDWKESFVAYSLVVGPDQCRKWLRDVEAFQGTSPNLDVVIEIMRGVAGVD
jgi:glycosyltransferase involved in cell wall biosynthesis